MVRVLVCGDRHWNDKDAIRRELKLIPDIELIIEGGAPGADTLAKEVADELNIPVLEFRAEWDKHGKAAGPIRNRKMLVEGRPDLVLAFHDDISKSKGTKDMINQARAFGVPVRIIEV